MYRKWSCLLLPILLWAVSCGSDSGDSRQVIDQLEKKVEDLENQIASLSASSSVPAEGPNLSTTTSSPSELPNQSVADENSIVATQQVPKVSTALSSSSSQALSPTSSDSSTSTIPDLNYFPRCFVEMDNNVTAGIVKVRFGLSGEFSPIPPQDSLYWTRNPYGMKLPVRLSYYLKIRIFRPSTGQEIYKKETPGYLEAVWSWKPIEVEYVADVSERRYGDEYSVQAIVYVTDGPKNGPTACTANEETYISDS